MHKISINGQQEQAISVEKGQVLIEGTALFADALPIGENRWSLIINNAVVEVEFVEHNIETRELKLSVNGKETTIAYKTPADVLTASLGFKKAGADAHSKVLAPMPGLIKNVFVEVGQSVTKGDNLLVLEAMKMENMIKSPADGIMGSVKVKPGDKVEKNTLLLLFQ